MQFNKKEVSLCKQVAEKHRKEIEIGDWALFENEVRLIIKAGFDIESPITGEKEKFVVFDDPIIPNLRKLTIHLDRIVPLWTISDCFEFLNQRDSYCVLLGWSGKTKRSKRYCHVYIANNVHEGEGYTYLEALLKMVLAVLEEGK